MKVKNKDIVTFLNGIGGFKDKRFGEFTALPFPEYIPCCDILFQSLTSLFMALRALLFYIFNKKRLLLYISPVSICF